MKAAVKVEQLIGRLQWMGIGGDGVLYQPYVKDLEKFGFSILSTNPQPDVVQIDLVYKFETLTIRYNTKRRIRTTFLNREKNFVFFFNTPEVGLVDHDFDYRLSFESWTNNILSVFKDERPWYARLFTY